MPAFWLLFLGMGVVYKAEDTRLKRTVALKFLSSEYLGSQEERARFLHEAQAAAALDHPNICTVHQVDEVEGHTFIVMSLIEGPSLRERIKAGPLEVREAIRIALEVGAGLEAAHEKGIVHRDIKSANILLSPKGEAKITDFGIAKSGALTTAENGLALGTATHMSPEQTRGESVDTRTDIWSLGVVLYEMITGRPPFVGDYEQAVVYSILNQDPEPLPSLRPGAPDDLDRIVRKALAKQPEDRYLTVGQMLADLRSVTAMAGDQPSRPPRGRFWRDTRVLTYAALAILMAVLLTQAHVFWPRPPEGIDSLAVLPLENLSGDPEQEYIADGMTEALIAELSKIEALRVISRTSVMQYKNAAKSLPAIARELNVDAIVEGSALQAGDRIRITAQLIEAKTDRHLWAESYERDIRDVLALQADVARAIAERIRITLTPEESRGLAHAAAVDPEAHEAVLRGRFHLNKLSAGSAREAISHFEQAIQRDPDYALAYAGLAEAYDVLASMGAIPPDEGWPRVRAEATKALRLDENLAVAHALIADVKFIYEWDWKGAEAEYRRAIELHPGSAAAHDWYALLLTAMGRHEEAIREARRALELDPISIGANLNAGSVLYMARRYGEAVRQLNDTLALDPGAILAHGLLLDLYLAYPQIALLGARQYDPEIEDAVHSADLQTDPPETRSHAAEARLQKLITDEAIARFERVAADAGPTATLRLVRTYASSGRTREARALLDEFLAEADTSYISPVDLAITYAAFQDRDRVFQWLERACENRAMGVAFLAVHPRWDPYRDDPRFGALIQKLGIET